VAVGDLGFVKESLEALHGSMIAGTARRRVHGAFFTQ
jgi:hypothetical protein